MVGLDTSSGDLEACRHEIAVACRVMARTGLVEDILGHISVRVGADHLLVRCRGPHEAGLAFSEPSDIQLVSIDSGEIVDDAPDGYSPPSELPIHTAVYRARPDVTCVVHAHPPDIVVASLAALPLLPIVGAYNIPATHLAKKGIPTHPRSVLINDAGLAAEMVDSLGDASVLVLAGHGLVSTGTSVPQAVLRALHVDTLARLTLGTHAVGREPRPIPDADFDQLPDLGSGFNEATLWRHHLRSLEAAGLAIESP